MMIIQEILKQWKEESRARGVLQFKYDYSTGTLTLYTPYCGWFIGRAGMIVDKYRDLLKSGVIGFKDINFIETEYEAIIYSIRDFITKGGIKMEDVVKAIELLKVMNNNMKIKHMMKDMDEGVTQEEIKEYRENFRLINVAIKLIETISKEPVDRCYLEDWYIHSVNNEDAPIWTTEHINELFNDFILIPKEDKQ